MAEVQINMQYPRNPDYDFVTKLVRLNLDLERENDIKNGKGFIIKDASNVKKEIKNNLGIFSSKFGPSLKDINVVMDRWKCECGGLKGRINHSTICPTCNTLVKFVDDDFAYFGWICLKDPYYIIHPNLYKSIQFLIGNELKDIITHVEEKDIDGFIVERKISKNKVSQFIGIGMVDFKDRFDEIMDYYLSKNPNKRDVYNDIMENKDLIFIQSIPVFTTLLRPFKIDGDTFAFEKTSALYTIMTKSAKQINDDDLKIYRNKKSKNQHLFDLQMKYCELYKEIEDILAQKKGVIRGLFGGRYSFSSRSVIIPNPSLRIDEVTLPYHGLVELLQQTIINILQKSYNMTYSNAYKMWYKAQLHKNDTIYNIINYIIKEKPRGIPILIN